MSLKIFHYDEHPVEVNIVKNHSDVTLVLVMTWGTHFNFGVTKAPRTSVFELTNPCRGLRCWHQDDDGDLNSLVSTMTTMMRTMTIMTMNTFVSQGDDGATKL